MNLPSPQSLTPQRLLMASVVVAIITIGLKTSAWYITDSVGLLSDAMESFVNLASAIFGLAMVTIAKRPADDDHPYGHHKAEYFSSGFEGTLIIGAAVAIKVPQADHGATVGFAVKRSIFVRADVNRAIRRGRGINRVVRLRRAGENSEFEAVRHLHVLEDFLLLGRLSGGLRKSGWQERDLKDEQKRTGTHDVK